MKQLITAKALWKGYDPTALPFDETVLGEEVEGRYTVRRVYFNGEATVDGCTRIYAQLYIPASFPNGASVALMNDIDAPFDTTYVNYLTEAGYTVLVLDYAGKRPDSRYTIYPRSLSKANYFTPDGDFLKITSSPKTSAWYVYACVMMRGYAYLRSRPDLDSNRVCLMGVRRGAFQVYKAASVLKNAACAVALFNSSFVPQMDLNSPDAMLFNTCLALGTYAPLVRIPTYMVESSNNHEDSLMHTGALYQASSDKCRLYIAEHSDNNLGSAQKEALLAFINGRCFTGREAAPPPQLTARNSDRALYYEIKVLRPEHVREVSLYYAYGKADAQYRNWKQLHLERISETEYIAKADVYLLKEETSAFASVRYDDGSAFSTPIITKVPMLMGVSAKAISRSRLVYDTEMGTDDWLITKLSDADGSISIVEGANGISGVTSSVNTLTTLKIGDVNTRGDRDSLLQLLIYSYGLQTLDIEVTCRVGTGYRTYSTMKKPEAYEEWSKITLSASEFKSPDGPMSGWDSAVSLTVSSENKLLINSLLWI